MLYLNSSGLETDKYYQSFQAHMANGLNTSVGARSIVPLHFKYDYANNRPFVANLRYDYKMISEQIMDVDKTMKIEPPMFQIGTQMITFTYSTPTKVIHCAFPYSHDMIHFFWFIKESSLQRVVLDQFKVFVEDARKKMMDDNPEFEHHAVQFPRNLYIVDAFNEHVPSQVGFKEFLVSSINNIWTQNNLFNVSTIPYAINQKVSEFNITKPIFVHPFFRGEAFDGIHKIREIERFTYSNVKVNEGSIMSTATVQMERDIIKEVRLPMPVVKNVAQQGYVMWLYSGFIMNDDEGDQKLYLGVAWFPNSRQVYPLRIREDMLK
ncbi:Conserved_hypothetical protein [Hexamita inflata]|uniref:Uncharacterized protein n=1 Tax=Hexamita inflata TaxID=28002 RepID=A0AA86PC23_9EUKA|nr:Conserved hypothetical protein [Hexamita inflata]